MSQSNISLSLRQSVVFPILSDRLFYTLLLYYRLRGHRAFENFEYDNYLAEQDRAIDAWEDNRGRLC